MTEAHDPAPSVTAMLEARSVAVVGASGRPGSFGHELLRQLRMGGFTGTVYPVNPRYQQIDGLPCLPSLADVPEAVDLAVLGVGNDSLEANLRRAGEIGSRAAVIFASCHEPALPGRPPLKDRLAALARDYGMALCGGNGMGFINFERQLRATGYSQASDLVAGPVTFLTHSGSAFSALLRNRRGVRFNLAVSGGDELVTTMADYLGYSLQLESTRVVAAFLETVHDPERFRAALGEAADRDIPIVALKVGRGELARRMVTAHSGALAGDDAAYEALFEHFGVLRVQGLDEMLDTVELLCAGRRAGPGGLATLHDSGGERIHLIDVAQTCGVRLAAVAKATEAALAAVLEPGLPPVNPLDAWNTSADAKDVFGACLTALHEDPDTAAVALCVDLVADESDDVYPEIACDAFATTTKPFCVLSNLRSAIDPDKAGGLRARGIPVLEGTQTGIRALGHLFALRDFATLRSDHAAAPTIIDGARAQRWATRLAAGPIGELDALRLLADYHVPVVESREVESLEAALKAAGSIGWPVALKTAAAEISHKTDCDGVRLNLTRDAELAVAYADIAARLGPRALVQAMVQPDHASVELNVGVVVDAQFGALIVVGAGGVLVEALADRSVALPPVGARTAMAMLSRLRIARLLDGRGGRRPVDEAAVARVITNISQLATELADCFEALDINPLIARPNGCVAVDALIVTWRPAPGAAMSEALDVNDPSHPSKTIRESST